MAEDGLTDLVYGLINAAGAGASAASFARSLVNYHAQVSVVYHQVAQLCGTLTPEAIEQAKKIINQTVQQPNYIMGILVVANTLFVIYRANRLANR
ncbi:MAG: hypothetical protein ABIG95_01390 [Candidatus Woesearchaeota archaeon]